MRLRRNRGGYTLIEVVTVAGILAMLTTAISMTWISAMRTFDTTNTQTFTDTSAVIAMQRIVTDVREAKSVELLNGGSRLRITFPLTDIGG